MTTPSPVEYALQAIVNALDPADFYEVLEGVCLNQEIEKEHLDALHATYPSILTKDQYQSLLHHFEE